MCEQGFVKYVCSCPRALRPMARRLCPRGHRLVRNRGCADIFASWFTPPPTDCGRVTTSMHHSSKPCRDCRAKLPRRAAAGSEHYRRQQQQQPRGHVYHPEPRRPAQEANLHSLISDYGHGGRGRDPKQVTFVSKPEHHHYDDGFETEWAPRVPPKKTHSAARTQTRDTSGSSQAPTRGRHPTRFHDAPGPPPDAPLPPTPPRRRGPPPTGPLPPLPPLPQTPAKPPSRARSTSAPRPPLRSASAHPAPTPKIARTTTMPPSASRSQRVRRPSPPPPSPAREPKSARLPKGDRREAPRRSQSAAPKSSGRRKLARKDETMDLRRQAAAVTHLTQEARPCPPLQMAAALAEMKTEVEGRRKGAKAGGQRRPAAAPQLARVPTRANTTRKSAVVAPLRINTSKADAKMFEEAKRRAAEEKKAEEESAVRGLPLYAQRQEGDEGQLLKAEKPEERKSAPFTDQVMDKVKHLFQPPTSPSEASFVCHDARRVESD